MEGTVGIMVITWLSVFLICLVLGTILAVFYRIKLTYVSTTAAQHAAMGRYWLGAQRPNYAPKTVSKETAALVKGMCSQFGLGAAAPAVTVDVSSKDFCSVQVKAIDLPLIKGPILPGFISFQDTSYQPFIKHAPIGFYGLTMQNASIPLSGMGMYYPSYGAGQGTPPPTSSPKGALNYFVVNNACGDGMGAAIGGPTMAGTYQNWDEGGPFHSYY